MKNKRSSIRIFGLLLFVILLILSCAREEGFEASFRHVFEGKKIDPEVLVNFDSQELRLLRNLVYAKYGYPFKSEELQHYFYGPGSAPFGIDFDEDPGFVESLLTEADTMNVEIILSAENNPGESKNLETPVKNSPAQEVSDKVNIVSSVSYLKFYQLLTENVINYYDLDSEYKTELQRKKFLESDEYQEKLAQIIELKEEMLRGKYRLQINPFVELSDYDVERGGFYMKLPLEFHPHSYTYEIYGKSNRMLRDMACQEMNAINGFYTGDEIFRWESGYSKVFADAPLETSVFLECSESDGLIIEKLRDEIQMYLDFEMIDNGKYVFTELLGEAILSKIPVIATKNAYYRFYNDSELLLEMRIPDAK